MIWMWDAVYEGLEGRPTDKTRRKPTKIAYQLVKREKNVKKQVSDTTKHIFSTSLSMNIHMTYHIYKIAVRRKCVLKYIFFSQRILQCSPYRRCHRRQCSRSRQVDNNHLGLRARRVTQDAGPQLTAIIPSGALSANPGN